MLSMHRGISPRSVVLLAWGLLAIAASALAQDAAPAGAGNAALPAFQLPGDLGLPGIGGQEEEPTFSAQFQIEKGSQAGRLQIKLQLPPEWHVYSLTQKKGGPLPSKIAVDSAE